MNSIQRKRAALGAALLFAVCFPALHAAPAAPPASAAASNDELIKLSEFNVSAGRASGYRAQSAITATGFDTPIIDVPVTINVLTGEFAQDVGSSLQSEVLRYVPDEADLRATERKVEALWQAIRRATETGDWRPRPGRLCDWCDHQERPRFARSGRTAVHVSWR